MPREII